MVREAVQAKGRKEVVSRERRSAHRRLPGYSALLDVHSAQTHYMLFPLGEWHPRHWGAFQAGLSTRCFTTRSQLNLAAFAAMWLMWLHCRPRLPIEILWTLLFISITQISHYWSCIINVMWWWQTFHELRYLVLKCHIWTSLYIKDTWHWSWCLMSCCFQ